MIDSLVGTTTITIKIQNQHKAKSMKRSVRFIMRQIPTGLCSTQLDKLSAIAVHSPRSLDTCGTVGELALDVFSFCFLAILLRIGGRRQVNRYRRTGPRPRGRPASRPSRTQALSLLPCGSHAVNDAFTPIPYTEHYIGLTFSIQHAFPFISFLRCLPFTKVRHCNYIHPS